MTRAELTTMLQCVLAARKFALKDQHIDWLMRDRSRCEYFDAVMRGE